MKRLVLVLLLVFYSSVLHAETEMGVAISQDDLQRAINVWKFSMANTRYRAQYGVISYGTFFWCKTVRGAFKYAYTYGEDNFSVAQDKAAYAFDALPEKCMETPKMSVRQERQ